MGRRIPENHNDHAAFMWAHQVAHLVVGALIDGKVVSPEHNAIAVGLVQEEIFARLAVRDYPPPINEK